jgi:hypothetical protein
MFDGVGHLPELRGNPLLLSLIDIDRKELQRRGGGEYSVYFSLLSLIVLEL